MGNTVRLILFFCKVLKSLPWFYAFLLHEDLKYHLLLFRILYFSYSFLSYFEKLKFWHGSLFSLPFLRLPLLNFFICTECLLFHTQLFLPACPSDENIVFMVPKLCGSVLLPCAFLQHPHWITFISTSVCDLLNAPLSRLSLYLPVLFGLWLFLISPSSSSRLWNFQSTTLLCEKL